VEHANFEYSERYLHNSAKSTIGWLKAQLEPQRAHGEPFANLRLTWKGVPQTDETRLDSLEGVEAAAAAAAEGAVGGLALVGHKTLIIHDIDLGEQMQAELTKIQDHFTIKQVFELYQEQQRRFYLHEPIIARWNEAMAPENMGELTHDMLLEQLTTVWEAQLATNAVIALKTQSFKVIIKEQAELERLRQRLRTGVASAAAGGGVDEVPGIEIDVFDFNRTRELKQQYSLAVTESLGPSDQIVLDTSDRAAGGAAAAAASAFDGELDDNDRLFKYGVRNGSVLLVKREDFTQPTSLYTCADCGSDVKLKQRDAVRCRECGHRIVFKKRIQKPCQYECR
jgi:DNA-directed RNA polymerase I, II, and III subunit RPABC4